MDTKICSKCGLTKPLEEFYAAASVIDGRRTHCKVCDQSRRSTRVSRHGNVGDAILSMNRNGFSENTSAKLEKSVPSGMKFERYAFNHNKAIERAVGSI